MITEGPTKVNGFLVRDEEGKPYKYVFKITDYISELLKSSETKDGVTLGIKVYNPTDLPTAVTDLKIKDVSWSPKGVVLYNHSSAAGGKKVKFEISYTELNN